MQTSLAQMPIRNAKSTVTSPMRPNHRGLAGVLAGAGTLLLPVAMFLPWYTGADGGTRSAWDGYWFVIAGMLALFLAGAWLVRSILAGRPLGGHALDGIIALSFAVTIAVVVALFIARPGGNTVTAAAFGGYVGLAAIGTIKGGAIVMKIKAHQRV